MLVVMASVIVKVLSNYITCVEFYSFVCVDQVRKTSQAALLVLLEQEVVERGETKTCLQFVYL